MLIGAVSSTVLNPSVLSTLGPPKPSAASSPAAAPAPTVAAATSAPAPAKAATSHAAPAPSPSASSAAAVETLAAVYSTTVGGKQYTGDIEQSGAEYTASVANLPGVSASGSSVIDAEINLSTRIDEIV